VTRRVSRCVAEVWEKVEKKGGNLRKEKIVKVNFRNTVYLS
jgi:transcriptional/translational regulatory protein YebC/TACO1